jgi:MarC family membrane protein
MQSNFLTTFAATQFALLNPLGVLPIFISYVAGERRSVQRWVALFLSLTVLGLLLLFLVSGSALLKFFGIDLDAFRVAGGILLLLIGINIVLGDPTKSAQDLVAADQDSPLKAAQSIYSKVVIPLAMPLLVGPGVIANVILYATLAEEAKDNMKLVGLAFVCLGISFLTFLIFSAGQRLQHLVGNVGLNVATRILGLLVASMGAQFILTGLTNVIVQTIAPQILHRP